MKRIVFLCSAALLTSAAPVAHAQQTGYVIETKAFTHPRPDDTIAGGTLMWHNAHNENHLSFERRTHDSISIVLIDYDCFRHPKYIYDLALHKDPRRETTWIVDSIMVTAYSKQPDGSMSPTRVGVTRSEFDSLKTRIIKRITRS
jgi:hypothetical protein